jgi:outer membrane protein OmpA-like peptidoglycan-associated protein
MEPEDVDGFEDENGCVDPDNDGDGMLDAADQCPVDAEDMDGFEDEDGCPDLDNDGDGVPDAADRCPMEPGPVDNQGCTWPDSDGDGVPDLFDSCVSVPGTIELYGCPEAPDMIIGEDRIEVVRSVYFRTDRDVIERRSFSLLNNVARVLNEHPEVLHVRIEGHADSRGSLEYNMRLSQQRAESVMRYLVEQGVDPSRLEAQGYGPTRPVVENATNEEELARNRNVAFTISRNQGDLQAHETETIDP